MLIQGVTIALLMISNIILAMLTVKSGFVRGKLHEAMGRLGNEYSDRKITKEMRKYSKPITVKMDLFDRMEVAFIDKSNIRHYLPFMNLHMLFLLMGLVFIIILKHMYGTLLFLPSAIIIALLFSLIPLFALDLMARYNSEIIRRRLAEFISILNRWCAVKEDIFHAFGKSVNSGIGEPLKTFVSEMVIQVSRGIEPSEALDILHMKVDNQQFRDFILNIKQNIKHRGDIIKLLTNLENQFYKIDEEYNRRRISTYKDRMLIYFVMFAVLFIGYLFIITNPQIKQFYLATLQGKMLLTFLCLIYAAGFYTSFGITKFRH